MLSYLDGVPLDKTHSNPERFQIGKVLARLRHATEGFSHIAENRYCAWDVQHLLTLEHLLEEVDDPTHQMALSQGLKRFCQVADKLKNVVNKCCITISVSPISLSIITALIL